MGNALRLFVFCLALTAVGLTAALSQLWIRNRAQTRETGSGSPPSARFSAYQADQQKTFVIITVVAFGSIIGVALAFGIKRQSSRHTEDTRRARGEINQVEQLAKVAEAVRERFGWTVPDDPRARSGHGWRPRRRASPRRSPGADAGD